METRSHFKPKLELDNLIIGIRPLMEAIEAGQNIDKIFIQKGLKGELISELKTLTKRNKLFYQEVPLEKIERITRKNHQGVIAFTSPVQFYNLGQRVSEVLEKGEIPLFMILDRISDVRNFGAIVRTAEALNIHGVIIPTKGAAQINEDTVKTSAGAVFNVCICKEVNLVNTIDYLKKCGLKIIAITEKTDKNLYSGVFNEPCAIVLGSEEDGISFELLKMCDDQLKIPISGKTESLNVSVAGGIALYEAIRQREIK